MIDGSIADDLLRNGYDRWLRLEEAKAEVSDDIKELMAELKGHGFTPKAVRESFRRVRNADSVDQQEHDAIVDLYVASLTRAHPARAHEKTLNNSGSISQSYADAKGRGEITDNQKSVGSSSDLREPAARSSDASAVTHSDSQVTPLPADTDETDPLPSPPVSSAPFCASSHDRTASAGADVAAASQTNHGTDTEVPA